MLRYTLQIATNLHKELNDASSALAHDWSVSFRKTTSTPITCASCSAVAKAKLELLLPEQLSNFINEQYAS